MNFCRALCKRNHSQIQGTKNKRRKINQESESHPRRREKKKGATQLTLCQRLHRMQLKPPPNVMAGKIDFDFRSIALLLRRERILVLLRAVCRTAPTSVSPAY
ncbi:hypothetical protein AVEN_143786-1 [Araneus ventricosus]|uniref:Uncharacterized protein n=1 Tax=Araneus ventricosus TaxID=182803 RepID=A0A4Y2APV1_ARAVE|nr:hypothetical protein AVEN_143786-1 [Araneus ventricosus]